MKFSKDVLQTFLKVFDACRDESGSKGGADFSPVSFQGETLERRKPVMELTINRVART